jgi:hypothetical protein
MESKVPDQYPTASQIVGRPQTTQLSALFFSKVNTDALHEGIRYMVYRHSKCQHVIGRQSDQELRVIMRSVFLEHARNLEFDIVKQVRDLNSRVLEFAVPRILQEISMHLLHQSETLKNPIPLLMRPKNASVAGTKPSEFNRL